VAQQAFSSDAGTTLHLAIPALETLHKAWSSRAGRAKYARFAPALNAAASKIDEYYEKTTESPAYVMAMSSSLCCCIITIVNFRISKYSTLRENWPTSRRTGQRASKKKFLLVQNKLYIKLCFMYLFVADKYKSLKHATLKWVNPHQHHKFALRREKQAVSRNLSARLKALTKTKMLEIPRHRLHQIR
jgi:hypothetical protein